MVIEPLQRSINELMNCVGTVRRKLPSYGSIFAHTWYFCWIQILMVNVAIRDELYAIEHEL